MTGLANSTNFAYFFYQGNTSGQNWSAGGHIGFRLASGNVGWVKLSPVHPPIEEFAYEDMGGPISAGHTIPNPAPFLPWLWAQRDCWPGVHTARNKPRKRRTPKTQPKKQAKMGVFHFFGGLADRQSAKRCHEQKLHLLR